MAELFRPLRKSDIGKYLIFRPLTRWGTPKLKRKITHVLNGGTGTERTIVAGVTYNGCRPFYVMRREIIDVISK